MSSTYEDLREERSGVMQRLLSADAIPVGMELFPSTSSPAWDHIKNVIAESDYYVLILAGKYGSSPPKSTKSYTELEYDYAQKCGIPTITFLCGDLNLLPTGKTEADPKMRAKLEAFRVKVRRNLCKLWTSPQQLEVLVLESYQHIRDNSLRPGWVRFSDEISDAVSLYAKAPSLCGLRSVSTTEAAFFGIDWGQLFVESTSLDIFFTRGTTWRRHHLGKLKAFCARPGTRLRIVLPKASDKRLMQEIAIRNRKGQSSQRLGIENAFKAFAALRNCLSDSSTLELYETGIAPTYTYYGFSSSAICSLYTYADPDEADEWACFIAERNSQLFEHFRREFEHVVARSEYRE